MQESTVKEPGLYAKARPFLIHHGIDVSRVDAIITEDIPLDSDYQIAIDDTLIHYIRIAAEVRNDPVALDACTKGLLADLSLFFAPDQHPRLYAEAHDVLRQVN